ncbi:MAG: PQQ-binding-like beta-propeller repeat protein [Candidatus Hydrogenedentes bacterium]|nr:PQQ-binding-like beta-propeller repeat protein [Candidatus Hydrogenedentota bacterium]
MEYSSPAFRGRNFPSVVVLCIIAACAAEGAADVHEEWRWYLGDPGHTHYSSLKQITTRNVARLKPAWTYHSGGKAQVQCNPIIVDGLLYGISAERNVFALHADTGREEWVHKPAHNTGSGTVVRGVLYWSSGSDKRIYACVENYIYAIDAVTGACIESFGNAGAVDIKTAYARDISTMYLSSTSPGVIYGNTLIISVRVNEAHPAAPGDIMAFDVLTGKRVWVFHTIPHPGEVGYETWPPDAWKAAGGANCWAGMSLDEKRGIVYVPTGSAAFDFYGADRVGSNLFANSVLALDAASGRRIWHFQTVHHDLWDRDLPAPPNLVTVKHNGKKRDAVAQITKSAHVFLLDRDTGEPLFPVEERPVPASDVPGEETSPTQPVPLKPPAFGRQHFTEDMVTNRTPEAHAFVLEKLRATRNTGPFTPPSLEGTLIFPGFDGGGEWGGAAYDPKTGMLYVNASEMAWILTLYKVQPEGGSGQDAMVARVYAENCMLCHGPDLKGDPTLEFPSLHGMKAKFAPAALVDLIRHGRERMPSYLHLTEDEVNAMARYLLELDEQKAAQMKAMLESSSQEDAGERWYAHTGYHRFVDQDGYPAVQPPWGTLTAIDLNKGELAWQVPLGETPELAAQGMSRTGTENYGGPVVTAGGLVFIAATKDNCIRAFDKKNGRELWKAPLPAAGYATPCTYEIDGRQYVAVAAAGGKIGSAEGDAYVAFSLSPRGAR